MTPTEHEALRVLIANELPVRLEAVSRVVLELGHVVIAPELAVDQVSEVMRVERPAVALVGLGESSEQALALISSIVRVASCPVVVLLEQVDSRFLREAARRGAFAHLTRYEPSELQAVIEVVRARFAEYQSLEEAFGRRAIIERAKGILMAVHAIGQQEAFDLLRGHSQRTGRKVIEIAEGVCENHSLLVPRQPAPPERLAD